MPYKPSPPPQGENLTPERIIEWVRQELERVAAESTLTHEGFKQVLHAEPPRPREGQIVFADGSDWDPGSGEGPYYFDGSDWQFMGAAEMSGWKCDEYTSGGSQTWTKPADVEWVIVEMQAGGGGGGGRLESGSGRAGGGGAGEWTRFWLRVADDLTVDPGACGAAGTSHATVSGSVTAGGDATSALVTDADGHEYEARGGKGGTQNTGGATHGNGGAAGGVFAAAAAATPDGGANSVTSADTDSGAGGSSANAGSTSGGKAAKNRGGNRGDNGSGGGGASYSAHGGDGAAAAVAAVKPGPGAGGGGAESVASPAAPGGDPFIRIYYLSAA